MIEITSMYNANTVEPNYDYRIINNTDLVIIALITIVTFTNNTFET